MILRLLAFVLPLGLDSFAVAAAVGAAGPLPARTRWRITALFVAFEAGMPLLGVAIGAPLARVIGDVADYVAAGAVVAVGVWMLLAGDDDDERAGRLRGARGTALLGIGIGISLDELAIGFGFGLSRLPLVPVIVGIAVQAFLAAQLGLRLGARLAERGREAAERVAGVALIALGGYLAAHRLFG